MLDLTRIPHDGLVGDVGLVELRRHEDERGALLPIDFDRLPFSPRRVFTVTGVPAGTVRGEHGHRSGRQLLICLQGRIDILLRRGRGQAQLTLEPTGPGLLIGPYVWCRQTYVVENSALLVLASEPYDPDSYVRHWE
jgi:dTDP-4-dehydrorhamnose 3,5-epimerase-like enzyme